MLAVMGLVVITVRRRMGIEEEVTEEIVAGTSLSLVSIFCIDLL
jgi:hypothetical protein